MDTCLDFNAAEYKILIVDDVVSNVLLLKVLLKNLNYQIATANDGLQALSAVETEKPDLILLDVGLPFQDGYQVCRRIRARSAVPIIVLTARNTDFDELLALNIGADDFVTKPYNSQVLLARIERLLARSTGIRENAQLSHKGLTLDLLQATASHDGREVALTKNEFTILRLLMMNQGSIIPRDAIIDALWQSEAFIDENTLNVNIARLRRKLADIGLADYLQTKRGMGYLV